MKLVTLKKSDLNFEKYLLGTFSQTEVALPVKNLNLGTIDESVTFEVVNIASIQRPSFLIFWAYFIKLRSYLFVMVPLFFVASKNYLDERFFDSFSLMLSSVSMFFLYAGLNLRSDLNDHLSGYDRIIESSQPKPLIKGWAKGSDVSFFSWAFMIVAAFLAIPIFILQQEEIKVVAVVFILFIIGQFFKKNSYKNQRLGEFILFILIGAGISSGYQVALGAGIDTEILFFGVLWGACVLFLVHLNNFSNILVSSQAGIQNTMTKMGFDKSKKFLIFWLIMINFIWIMFHYFYASTFWSWLTGLVLIFWSIPTAIQFSNLSSPVGSDLSLAKKTGNKNFLLLVTLLFVEQLWYLGSKIF